MEYNRNLEALSKELDTRKDNVKRFLLKHFKINKDFIIIKKEAKKSGRPREAILLTEKVYQLMMKSYNISNRYSPHTQTNTIMSVENQTIGFIESCLTNVYVCTRQRWIGNYKCDLCIDDYKIVVECDEWGHKSMCKTSEEERQRYIESQGYTVLRFNPNEEGFDLSLQIRSILQLVAGRK